MNAINQQKSIEALQGIMTSAGLDVAIGGAAVKKVCVSTIYHSKTAREHHKADYENRLDIIFDLLLKCGEDYEIDATMVYGSVLPHGIPYNEEQLLKIINKSTFNFQFDSDFISGNMADNICIYTKNTVTMDAIFATQGDNFDSMGEGENGKTCLLLIDDTANRACYFLEHALNNQGFDAALITELDQHIRSGAITTLRQTSEA